MSNKLLVIIVTYNPMTWIDNCIGSVKSSSIKSDIIVIDNCSTDNSAIYIQNTYPEIIFIQNNINMGFGRANNIGLQYAIDNDYDYVYLLNQDAYVKPNTFERMINVQLKNQQYGILSPIQMQANENHLDKNFSILMGRAIINQIDNFMLNRENEILEVNMTMAAHWLISKKCFSKVGGFSPVFPHYCEDNNYADRSVFHGFKNGVVLNAFGIHDREVRIESGKQKMYMNYIITIKELSSLLQNKKHPIIAFFYRSFKNIIKYRTFLPIYYLFRLLYELNDIKRAKEASKNECSFLIKK